MGFLRKKTTAAIFGGLLSCVIVISFCVHALELQHEHPGNTHHTHSEEKGELIALSDYFHGTEKKSFLYVLLGFFVLSIYVLPKYIVKSPQLFAFAFIRSNFLRHTENRPKRFSYLCWCFKRGILNPKYY